MSKPIALFFMPRSFGGGTTSYTAHLYEGMRLAGYEPTVYRVKERGETDRPRPFAKYDGVTYRNVDSKTALAIVRRVPSLMTAPCNSRYLEFDPTIMSRMMRAGMRVTVHDPSELVNYDERPEGAFCVRPAMKKLLKSAKFIPHPFVREYGDERHVSRDREFYAVSVARVTFVKRTELILEANESLSRERRVVLRGFENRVYTRFKVMPRFSRYRQGLTGFHHAWGSGSRECARGHYAVDFSWFAEDGGGSQYTFMEAWDAGTANVVHEDWLRYRGEMVHDKNCVGVKGSAGLVELLKNGRLPNPRMMERGYDALRTHDPVSVARAYYRELTR